MKGKRLESPSTTAKTCCGAVSPEIKNPFPNLLADAPHSPSPLWFILSGQLLLDRKRRMKNNNIIIIMLGVFVAIMAALLFRLKLFTVEDVEDDLRLFTVEELALYNGTHPDLPILLGILGSVFDVTEGKSHYGTGGGYNHFAGRDASRAFVSGNFTGDGLTDSLQGLSSSEVKSVVEWRDFYFRSYIFVGKLVGRYYDSQGNSTKYLKGVEVKAARGAQLLEKQKKEEAKQPSCNSRWSQGDGGEVWCDVGVPRLVQRPLEIALTGKMSKRCACFKEEQLGQPGLEVYDGCDFLGKSCRV